jgi:hypothetical protein
MRENIQKLRAKLEGIEIGPSNTYGGQLGYTCVWGQHENLLEE